MTLKDKELPIKPPTPAPLSVPTLSSSSFLYTMKAVLALLSCLLASTLSAPKNDLTCSICVDIVTDIDNFITSDTTEQQIVEFVEQVREKQPKGLPYPNFRSAIYI